MWAARGTRSAGSVRWGLVRGPLGSLGRWAEPAQRGTGTWSGDGGSRTAERGDDGRSTRDGGSRTAERGGDGSRTAEQAVLEIGRNSAVAGNRRRLRGGRACRLPRASNRGYVRPAMDRPRVADAQIGGGTPAAPATGGSRVSRALASPLAILFIIPGLVALVGMFLTFTGDRALRGSNLESARDRLSEQTRLVAANIRQVLAQAEPVLDRLADRVRVHDTSAPFEAFAHALADLVQGRPGIAYVSASFPDGTFQGAYVDDDAT